MSDYLDLLYHHLVMQKTEADLDPLYCVQSQTMKSCCVMNEDVPMAEIAKHWYMINVLKFWQNGIGKQFRPRSDCSWRSSLIRVYTVWHSTRYFRNNCINSKIWAKKVLSKLFDFFFIVLGFNDTSTLVGHFVSSPKAREKRDRRDSRGDERKGQGRKRNRTESREIEEIKTSPIYPYLLQG